MRYEIYKVTNLSNNKIYIGLTTEGYLKRWSRHLKDAKNESTYIFHKAIRKYGEKSFTIQLIDSASSLTEMKEKEIYWIAFYKSNNRTLGYNMTNGGDGTQGLEISSQTRNLHTNQHLYEAVSVHKINNEGQVIKTYTSYNEAARDNNCSPGNVKQSCETGCYCKGFHYKIANIETEGKFKVVCEFYDGKVLNFKTIKEAADYFNIFDKTFYSKLNSYNRINFIDAEVIITIDNGLIDSFKEDTLYEERTLKQKEAWKKVIEISNELKKDPNSTHVKGQQESHPGKKCFIKVNLQGEVVQRFSSQKECIRETGYTVNRVKHAARNFYIIDDHFWIMEENLSKITPELIQKTLENKVQLRKVIKMDLKGNKLETYNNCAEAARSVGAKSKTSVALCCDNYGKLSKYKTAYGCTWKYAE